MRKRWEFNPFPYIVVWLFGGSIPWTAAVMIWDGGDRVDWHLGTVGIVGLCLWLGPFALAICAGVIWIAATALWKARPHRITEPVTDDLRKVLAQRSRGFPSHD